MDRKLANTARNFWQFATHDGRVVAPHFVDPQALVAPIPMRTPFRRHCALSGIATMKTVHGDAPVKEAL